MVTPVVVTGRPASRAAMRAMLLPDSASGMAQPRMTSSISSLGTWGYLCEQGADGGGGEVVGARVAEGAAVGLSDGRAKAIDDDCFRHLRLQIQCRTGGVSGAWAWFLALSYSSLCSPLHRLASFVFVSPFSFAFEFSFLSNR